MAVKQSYLANGNSTHVVETTIRHYLDPSKGGEKDFWPGTVKAYKRKFDSHTCRVTDVRGHEDDFNLDRNGFEFIKHESKLKEFPDSAEMTVALYPEVAALLKERTGATHAIPFSHVIREEKWEDAQKRWEGMAGDEVVRVKIPARFAHVDHSYSGAETMLEDNIEDEAERTRLAKTRWAIINVWRPIHRTVTRDPLAVCDASSVAEEDLVGSTAFLPPPGSGSYNSVSKGKQFETWAVRANPAHRWYYKSQMQTDEALLIKIFDSKKDGRARCTPHTSFTGEEDYGEARNSIEIRCFAFWEDQTLE